MTCFALSHSAISSTLLIVALRARIWMSGLTCISRANTTSNVGPRSASFRRCTSSAMTREISSIHLARCLRRESAFSFVVMITSYLSSHGSVLSKSPVLMPTLILLPSLFVIVVCFPNSSNFSFAKALNGVR